jgi:hypothetical protein
VRRTRGHHALITTTSSHSPSERRVVDAAPVRRGLLALLLAALFSAAGLLLASPAAACSCAEADTAQHFADADAVFTGSLLSRDVDHPDWPTMSSGDPALHVFATDTVFKGEVHEQQGVVSAADSSSCGLSLAGEGPFVVFATRDPGLPAGQYRAGLCGGTGVLDPTVAAELEDLTTLTGSSGAPGGLPSEGSAGVQGAGLGQVAVAFISVGSLAVVAVAWILLHRLRRRRATQ